MSTAPHALGKFYTERSTFTRRTGAGADATATFVGGDKIQQEVNKLGFLGCRVGVKSIDGQKSPNDALFISCSGLISIQDDEERLFYHSFFLEMVGRSYFILNDVFSLIDKRFVQNHTPDEANKYVQEEEEEQVVEEPTMNGNHGEPLETVVAEPEPVVEKVVVETPAAAAAAAAAAVPSVADTTATAVATVVPVTPVVVEKEVATVAAVVVEKETPPTPTPKTTETKPTTATVAKAAPTYAEMISMAKPSSATPQSTTPLASPTNQSTAPAAAQPATTTTSTTNNNNKNNDRHHPNNNNNNKGGANQSAEKNKDNHKEGCTIFITPTDPNNHFDQDQHKQPLRSLFTPFGTITNVRVLSSYAFVEFEKPETVQEVLNKRSKSPMTLGDSITLKIEEKRNPFHSRPPFKKNQRSQDKQQNENINNNNSKNNENNNNNLNNKQPQQPQQQQQPKTRVQSPKPVKQQQPQQQQQNDTKPIKVNLNK
ncbi:RNA recognition motif-containing protein RRM [Cavenderia fasciculata]|uniref:RNA recognition motif-containing protein RRM n=1 Tax=Cavenderia fasciculata TaxID=261658 RepID=F4QB48_CACFS|nr:RNA recognition motif-containing protein RRM [Cavenderia fasciculata]EGG14820.1 RNA recognition motif-containing protein RRM [Cavenderia fasciculata]|eukprot:XP_004351336.1 RNA recognition motif-containing protein RRM [Cavenderia fasciculata]